MCPVGHLCHRAYCGLCFGVARAQSKQPHTATKTIRGGHETLIKKSFKIDTRGCSRRLLGEVFGPFRSGVTQNVPGTPLGEKVIKSLSFPNLFYTSRFVLRMHFQPMPKPCPNCAQTIPKPCPNHTQTIPNHVQIMPKPFPKPCPIALPRHPQGRPRHPQGRPRHRKSSKINSFVFTILG